MLSRFYVFPLEQAIYHQLFPFIYSLIEGTPPREHSPEPPLIKGLIYSGADMIRRKLVGGDTPERQPRMTARNKILLSRQEKRALRSLRLVEKVESIGLDNIIQTHHPVGISPLAMGVRSRTASPMTQLTSLKNIQQNSQHHSARNDDPYALDRDTIRAVLNKGMSHDRLSDISTDGSTTSSITNPHDSDDSLSSANRPPSAQHAPADDADAEFTTAAGAITSSPVKAVRSPASTGEQARRGHSDFRLKQIQRQKSRRGLLNNSGGQRPDLGTVGAARRDSAAKSRHNSLSQPPADDEISLASSSIAPQTQSMTQMFVGSISSLFFGRKGGLL